MSTTAREEVRLRKEWLLTTAFACLLLVFLVFTQWSQPIGHVLYDRMMTFHGFKESEDIVIIAVDDRSLQELGGWPLQRSRYTELLRRLADPQSRPKAVGIDLLFLDSTPHDVALAAAMEKVRPVLPLEFSVIDGSDASPQPQVQYTLPAKPLDQVAQLAHINVRFDSDGVIRGFQSIEADRLHFALAMHRMGAPSEPRHTSADVESAYYRFRMVDPSIGFPVISLSDALSPSFPLSVLKNKYVLVGVTAPSLGDRYPTLYSGTHGAGTPGVAILASILNASLNNTFITTLSPSWVFALNLVGVALLLASLILFKPRVTIVLAVATILVACSLSYALLVWGHWWVNPVPLIVVAALIQPFWAWRRLEAITAVIYRRAAELRQLQPEERAQHHTLTSSREVVLQYAKLLDHAVDSARNELNFLSAVIDEMPDAVVIYDQDEAMLLLNSKMQKLLLGHSLGIGSHLSALAQHWNLPLSYFSNLANPEPHEVLPVRPSTNPGIAQQHVFQIESTLGRRDMYLKNACIDSPMGGQLRLLIFMDITELRQYQVQRDRALQFLSHDMRTPLASILSLTRPSQAQDLPREKIDHHARALLAMMDDFILTVNAEAPRYDLTVELIDNLINDAMEQVSDLAQEKQIRIVDELADGPLFVQANARLFIRALINLLFNAVKFSPSGATVTVSTHTQTDGSGTQWAHITIANTVYADQHEQDLPGFGLGLNFVDTVVERHKGQIVRSIPLSGNAKVVIELPLHTHISP